MTAGDWGANGTCAFAAPGAEQGASRAAKSGTVVAIKSRQEESAPGAASWGAASLP